MFRRTIVSFTWVSLTLFWCLSFTSQVSYAQADPNPEDPGPESPQITLQLTGAECDANEAEAAILHLKGVEAVDSETKPGLLIVSYDNNSKLNGSKMITAIGLKGGKGKKQGCTAKVVK